MKLTRQRLDEIVATANPASCNDIVKELLVHAAETVGLYSPSTPSEPNTTTPENHPALAERIFQATAIQKLKFPSPQDDTLSPAYWADVANRSRIAARAFAFFDSTKLE